MCICAIAWRLFPDKPLLLLANRDEFFERPTVPLHHWGKAPILAGQDLSAGGTWLGINPNNHKWAVILNFREIVKDKPNFTISRGQIISEYLQSEKSPLAFAKSLKLAEFDGFNLILGNKNQAVMLNNKGFPITLLANDLYVVSNGQPEGFEKTQAWYKAEHLRLKVRQEILPLAETGQDFVNASFNILADSAQAPIEQLPQTGLSCEMELALSSIFIPPDRLDATKNGLGRNYGTRCSSVIWLNNEGFEFYEKTFLSNHQTFLTHFYQ